MRKPPPTRAKATKATASSPFTGFKMSVALDPRHALDRIYGPSKKFRIGGALFFLLVLVSVASIATEVNLVEFVQDVPKGLVRAQDFFVPEFASIEWPAMGWAAIVTVLLAAIPTPIGIFFALLLGLAAAKNLSPSWLRYGARALITGLRGMPEFVIMVLVAAAFGLGPYPGIVAIVIGSIGMLGRLFADAIEEVEGKVMESIEATGATHWQAIRYGVLPEVMPSIIANSIFRFEINMRQAGLLGAVGAGGLGYELAEAINTLEYGRASTILLITLAIIFITEKVSDQLRKRITDKDAI
ncbi:MAG: phosphonate ABC transporter, permease protein PhnE [Verrucomicrobiota bacterium]